VSDRVQSTSAASIWHARRQGLSRRDLFQTLETHWTTALPVKVRSDIERWSQPAAVSGLPYV